MRVSVVQHTNPKRKPNCAANAVPVQNKEQQYRNAAQAEMLGRRF